MIDDYPFERWHLGSLELFIWKLSQTERNMQILETVWYDELHRKIDTAAHCWPRFAMAIYRLYRYCDITPKEIANYLNLRSPAAEAKINYVIGEVFAYLVSKSPDKEFFEKLLDESQFGGL